MPIWSMWSAWEKDTTRQSSTLTSATAEANPLDPHSSSHSAPPQTNNTTESSSNMAASTTVHGYSSIDTTDRLLFKQSPRGYKSPNGLLIRVLQNELRNASLYSHRVDGDYGPNTEHAVRVFQQQRGVLADGSCRESDWVELTGMPVPSVFDRCLNLTASFEGTDFTGVVGNFDDAFVTFGMIGLTLKHDLPEFVAELDSRFGSSVLNDAMGSHAARLRSVLNASDAEKRRFGDSISLGAKKYAVRDDWKSAFRRLGERSEVQLAQLERARDKYWRQIALRDAARWRAVDMLDVALFYDTAVQNGGTGRPSINGPLETFTVQHASLSGSDRRLQWARLIADGSRHPWQEDVYSRRSTIALGEGVVHGAKYLVEDWGLTPVKVDLQALPADHMTVMPQSSTMSASPNIAYAPSPLSNIVPVPQSESSPAAPPAVAAPALSTGPYDLVSQFKQAIGLALVHIQHDTTLDRNWGEFEAMPLHPILAQHDDLLNNSKSADWQDWDTQRKAVAIIQIAAKKRNIDPGPIDGFWGQRTDSAFEALVYYRDHGELPPQWRDITPIDANPNGWPRQTTSELIRKYGEPCKMKLVRVACPWPLRLAWALNQSVTHISCHEAVAESLDRVLDAIYENYGRNDAEMRRLRLDRFGGSYNCRQMRGGSRWSTHAWAIAIDWDPDLNKLRWGRDRANLAKPEYTPFWEIWEKEGWLSLGRHKNYDWMHVQAARL